MLQLKHLSKTYFTKNKSGVRALDDVNLSFPDKGLCLVMGPSGCGKTTLLNILGGLDVKYEGEFVFLNKKLSAKDFADYRKNYVSFVFQDYNLIEDLDVSENLSIGYNFASKDGETKQEDVLKKVGLEDCEYRFPQELSGGEQQRVTIARALLKDSKVLLADEPTGNLDKDNSTDIYNLLKEISLKKLVIVVSHDEQLGLKYADYVVRLDEGKVVENNLPQTDSSEQYVAAKSKAIRAKIAWQMAWYEFTRKKSRSILTVIALIICLSLVSFAMPLLFYNSADPHYALTTQYGYDKILLNNLTYETYTALRDNGVQLAPSNYNGSGSKAALVFSSKQQALDYGIEFYQCDNELPLRADTYYISDKYLTELIMYGNNRAVIDGQEVMLNLMDYELTDIVGGKLDEFGRAKTCAGIYYYPEEPNGLSPDEKYSNEWHGAYITAELVGAEPLLTFVRVHYNNDMQYLPKGTSYYGVLTIDSKYMRDESSFSSKSKYVLLDDQGKVTLIDENSCNHLFSEDGVYFNLRAFNGTFNEDYYPKDLIDWNDEERSDGTIERTYFSKAVPQELGDEFSIEVYNRMTNKAEWMDGQTLKGIIIDVSDMKYVVGGYKVWFGEFNDLLKFKMLTNNFNAWANLSDIYPLFSGMRSLSSDYGCGFNTSVTSTANTFEELQLANIKATVVYVAVAMSVVSVLAIGLLISGQILTRKREVGIFKALGAKSGEIAMIYVYEAIIIAAFVIVLSIVLAVLSTLLFNYILFNGETVTYFHWSYGLLATVVMAALFCVGSLLPVFRLNSLNVIESIRSKADK